ncbi:DUF4231 domain-containing protein [Streptomyces rhizosphaerihabitans]|uniref:DUF4231 domain-containing protein n=1 Tax=Streptomyces rhizosphaerihabitans TaxID=1266770 RepID=UPI0021C0B917|nr:DUF4231 domain-containing protein [Streptomyces rhizosphaerihabitans]MCT9011118.1 DUF4231 domain-containing protein [Streptomyces rhizosphaerihabitans]
MGVSTSLLAIEQKIIEAESEVDQKLFQRRLTRLWLFGLIPLLSAGILAGNLLIDFSRPGSGRGFLNAAIGIPLTLSVIGAPIYWFSNREELLQSRMNLRKLIAEREFLHSKPDQPEQSLSNAFRRYHESVPSLRDDYRRGANKYRNRHNWFQISVIIGSILTSVATTASAEQGVWSWTAVALSAIVSISAGIISYFKFRERSMNLQQTADSIDLEMQAFDLGIRRYRNLNPEEAASYFAEEVERIKEEQRKKELQLEQPPEAQQGHSNRQNGSAAP